MVKIIMFVSIYYFLLGAIWPGVKMQKGVSDGYRITSRPKHF